MPITPLMLKKQPDIVTTLRKLRKYIGPQIEPTDPKISEEWGRNADRIRVQAEYVLKQLQLGFTVNEGESFWDVFERALAEFREETKLLDDSEIVYMVVDPTEKKKLASK